jgi:hypothetical protein
VVKLLDKRSDQAIRVRPSREYTIVRIDIVLVNAFGACQKSVGLRFDGCCATCKTSLGPVHDWRCIEKSYDFPFCYSSRPVMY